MAKEKEKFALRLNEALDDMNYPRMGHGRQSALAKEMKLSAQAVGRWLKGEDFPKTSELVRLSAFLDVRSNWLLSGIGPKYPKKSTSGNSYLRIEEEEEAAGTPGPQLDKEGFEIALAWMKLPVMQRIALKKVINELLAAQQIMQEELEEDELEEED